ncbi:hypothetical protein ED715_26240 [Escherichia coli]|nr:hypothetical protein [Escherichia coli]MFC95809.1 hypothetical protein [Escherichia coli]MFY40149.1 hypothetical protein [Escherichia coli]
MTDFGGKTSIFSHPVYLFLRKFSLQDSRGGSAATHLSDLPPRFLMVMAFAILCLLRQPGRPRIGFLFVRSWICFTLPSDPASRRRPCASLVLRHHQAGQGTFTPELLNMPGT